jgi:cytochrome c oxidase subunit 4
MPPQEQAELWMALRDRMKVDWNELTMQEKKAGTFSIHKGMPMPFRAFFGGLEV